MDGKLKETIDAMDAVSLEEHAFSWLLYLLDVPPSTIVPTFFLPSSTGETAKYAESYIYTCIHSV